MVGNYFYQVNKIRSEHEKILSFIEVNLGLPANYTLISETLSPYKSDDPRGCIIDFPPCLTNYTRAKYSFSVVDRTREQVLQDVKEALAVTKPDSERQFDQHLDRVKSNKYPGNFDMVVAPYELARNEQAANDECYAISDNGAQNNCRYEVYKNRAAHRMDLTVTIYR